MSRILKFYYGPWYTCPICFRHSRGKGFSEEHSYYGEWDDYCITCRETPDEEDHIRIHLLIAHILVGSIRRRIYFFRLNQSLTELVSEEDYDE